METNSLFVVFTKRLAAHLCDEGFELVKVERNDRNPSRYVYLFEDTPKLRDAIERYKGGACRG